MPSLVLSVEKGGVYIQRLLIGSARSLTLGTYCFVFVVLFCVCLCCCVGLYCLGALFILCILFVLYVWSLFVRFRIV